MMAKNVYWFAGGGSLVERKAINTSGVVVRWPAALVPESLLDVSNIISRKSFETHIHSREIQKRASYFYGLIQSNQLVSYAWLQLYDLAPYPKIAACIIRIQTDPELRNSQAASELANWLAQDLTDFSLQGKHNICIWFRTFTPWTYDMAYHRSNGKIEPIIEENGVAYMSKECRDDLNAILNALPREHTIKVKAEEGHPYLFRNAAEKVGVKLSQQELKLSDMWRKRLHVKHPFHVLGIRPEQGDTLFCVYPRAPPPAWNLQIRSKL
jgi:hypothetical protein